MNPKDTTLMPTNQNTTPLSVAQLDHAEKSTALQTALAAVESATALVAQLDASALNVDAAGLDAVLGKTAQARLKLDALTRRLTVARDREAAAATAVKEATIRELEAASALASSKLVEEDEAIQATVLNLVSQLLGAWTAARAVLRSAGSAASAVAKAKGVQAIDQRGVIAAQLKTTGSGQVDALASTQALVSYINAAPQRAAEQRQREEAKVAAKTQADMAGTNGIEAQDAARVAAREFMVANGMTYVGTERVREHRQARPPMSEEELRLADESDLYARGAIAGRHIEVA